MKNTIATLVAVMLLAMPGMAGEKGPMPSSRVQDCPQVADDAVTLDGDLSDKAWALAQPMAGFQTAGPKPQPAKYLSAARLLWSDKRLFLAFACTTDEIRSTLTGRDDAVYEGECAELYLCPRGAEAKYYEIDVNPQNALYDSMLHSHKYLEQVKHGKAWALAYNAKVESRTRVQKDANGKVTGWTVELAIPFADLAEADHVPPQADDSWFFNVFRIAQTGKTECEYSAWVPTYADFHKPWLFPRLRFTGDK